MGWIGSLGLAKYRAPYGTKGRLPKKNPEKVWSFAKPGGGSPRVNKKPNLKFGVLKRAKNGLKWLKNDQKT